LLAITALGVSGNPSSHCVIVSVNFSTYGMGSNFVYFLIDGFTSHYIARPSLSLSLSVLLASDFITVVIKLKSINK
jgi:hypothetical protein